MKIGIIGNGPAALFSAWAALQFRDTEVELMAPSFKTTPPNAGVFYLHDDLGLPLRSAMVQVSGFGGEPEDYAQKVYGRRDMHVSFPVEKRCQRVWDAAQALELVRDIVNTSCVRLLERSVRFTDLEVLAAGYDLVVNTAPLHALGGFSLLLEPPYSSPAWVYVSDAPADESYVLYSAHPQVHWYRCSAVFGRFAMETAQEPPAGGREWRKVSKVMCDYQPEGVPDNVLLTGRYGSWSKSALSHNAFDDTYEAIRRMQ